MKFTKILSSVVKHTKENIIDGEGYEKGIFKTINQNIILMLISKLNILINLTKNLSLQTQKIFSGNSIIQSQIISLIESLQEIKSLGINRIFKMSEKM